jgi:glycosyltransferase involved in cell wall biosynthesis
MINLFLVVYDFSGAKTYTEDLSEYLANQKDISVFKLYLHHKTSTEFTIEENGRMTNIYVPEKVTLEYGNKYYERAALLVCSRFQGLQNIILHANAPEQFNFIKAAKNYFQCPVIFTFHFLEGFISYIDYEKKYSEKEQVTGNVLPGNMLAFSDHIICVTKFAKRAVKNYYKIASDKVTTIYNGRHEPGKINESFSRSGLKFKYGFEPADTILLFAGPLQARKGIDAIIKAFVRIKNDYPNLKLVFAGAGEYDKFLPMSQICPGRICFTGHLDYDKLTDFYRMADIGILPSHYEQGGYVTIEMMQFDLPIIVTDVPGLNEMVIHGKSGLICKVLANMESLSLEADISDLVKQIKRLLDNPSQASELSKKAKHETKERFSTDVMGKKTYKIYRELIHDMI